MGQKHLLFLKPTCFSTEPLYIRGFVYSLSTRIGLKNKNANYDIQINHYLISLGDLERPCALSKLVFVLIIKLHFVSVEVCIF